MQKPSIPKGTRDFLPDELLRRKWIFRNIEETFKLYGFLPLETPAMEQLTTLTGKYGAEGDKLIFKILNSGNFLDGIEIPEDHRKLTEQISEKALRYDLTVPFARLVVQHRNEINFPFRRYQVQPVWRADRPQRGRYREFYQCDADVIGSKALVNELEMLSMARDILSALGLQVELKVNNRKILQGICEAAGASEHFSAVATALDKLDKVSQDEVVNDMKERGVSEASVQKMMPLFTFSGKTNDEKMQLISEMVAGSETGAKGVAEMEELLQLAKLWKIVNVSVDVTLARGLDYYTGTIIEVKSTEVKMGSIAGGGRYDDLTGVFGLKDVSGVGISFGADRIYDVIEELKKFPENVKEKVKVMIVNFGGDEEKFGLKLLKELRGQKIASIIYPSFEKIKKQLTYAHNLEIPFVVIAGSIEIENDKLMLKNMVSGEQLLLPVNELSKHLR